jgi:hypothetical protein
MHRHLDLLPYEVTAWSSYSAQYHPKNIIVSKPSDQSSRWSSGANNQQQYITLKLSQPAIVRTLLFQLPVN